MHRFFWTHCIKDRQSGWLNDRFHLRFRELLCHQLHRYAAICPVYCLMPDHLHLLVTGVSSSSNQLLLTRQLRRALNLLILPLELQSQAYDHVLKTEEISQSGHQAISYYIRENPVRKGLCSNWREYPFCGCMIPGYFDLDPRQENFWEIFWRIHNQIVIE